MAIMYLLNPRKIKKSDGATGFDFIVLCLEMCTTVNNEIDL